MGWKKRLQCNFGDLAVLVLATLVPVFAQALALPPQEPPKSYAVFVARYHTDSSLAVGGVAGTAFFVEADKAVTAFHVLQGSSFAVQSENEKVRIWLVHENEKPIEVFPENLKLQANKDLTLIHFAGPVVPASKIYQWADSAQAKSSVSVLESDGFQANSLGPELQWSGQDIEIRRVQKLERIHAQGQILQRARVDLAASDVHLRQTDCVQVGFLPVVGLSGGPLTLNGRIVGMNSFAGDQRSSTWAVVLEPKTLRLLQN
jgi:hypothetical protein